MVHDTSGDGGRPGRDADTARRVRALIDLTDLADDRSGDGIDGLCSRAAAHHTAAVCVWPEHVARCVELLDGTAVRVATVVNFPTGDDDPAEVVGLTERALAAGADDIDVVIPYRAVAAGDDGTAASLLAGVRAIVAAPAVMKVILETGELGRAELISHASRVAIAAGADFLKTSTGKTPVGATLAAAELMLSAGRDAGGHVGLKPSGGIRTVADAAAYLDLADQMMGESWATPSTFRFGASGLLDDVVAVIAGRGSDAATTDY